VAQESTNEFQLCLQIKSLILISENDRNWRRKWGKVRRLFGPEYCFQVPSNSETFLPEPARTLRYEKLLICLSKRLLYKLKVRTLQGFSVLIIVLLKKIEYYRMILVKVCLTVAAQHFLSEKGQQMRSWQIPNYYQFSQNIWKLVSDLWFTGQIFTLMYSSKLVPQDRNRMLICIYNSELLAKE
jgi:hypothetical protein